MSAETRYRLLLLSYPPAVRDEVGEEMLDLLLATDHRRGPWERVAEGVSLVRHGLAQRTGRAHTTGAAAAAGLAGAALACVLAVGGLHGLVRAGVLGAGLTGYPDRWGIGALWVDPRWPVLVAWVLTAVALVAGRARLTVLASWTAAVLATWQLVAATAPGPLPWLGHVGPHWTLGPGAVTAVALSVVTAVLLGSPGRVARAQTALGRRWPAALGVGVVAILLLQLAASATYAAIGVDSLAHAEDLRRALGPVLLTGVVLAAGLVRTARGRAALFLVGLVGAAPLALRLPTETGWAAAAIALLATGYAAGSARVSAPSRPGR